jgi:hypothetical protein
VRVRMWGPLTRAAIMTVVQELIEHPSISADFSQVIDLTEASSTAITADDLRKIAASNLDHVARRAFVTPDSSTYGLARMFEALRNARRAPEQIAVFRTLQHAEAWLA